jgi:hypothetical protein
MFGPAASVTAFSKALIEHKTDTPLSPADTPDFSVGCLNFANGVAARPAPGSRQETIACASSARMVRSARTMHFTIQSPVHLERFSRVSLSARKAYTVRTQPLIGRIFGIGGRRLSLVRRWKSHAVEAERGVGRSLLHKIVSWLRRREIYAQDKLLGIAEMVRAIREGRPQPMPPDFLIHLNELTLLIQRSGPEGVTTKPHD